MDDKDRMCSGSMEIEMDLESDQTDLLILLHQISRGIRKVVLHCNHSRHLGQTSLSYTKHLNELKRSSLNFLIFVPQFEASIY